MIELINRLAQKNIRLTVIGKDLKVSLGDNNEVLTEDVIGEIRQNKEALIDYLNQYSFKGGYQRIERLPDAADYPVSDGQRRLWITDQLGSSPAYHLPGKMKLNGKYNAPVLEKSI